MIFQDLLQLDQLARFHPLQTVVEGDPGGGDRRSARAAVGLKHIAVDRDLTFAERRKIDDGSDDRPISRWISCVRPLCFRSPPHASCARRSRAAACRIRVIQPLPPLRQAGTFSSRLAGHRTCGRRSVPGRILPHAWRNCARTRPCAFGRFFCRMAASSTPVDPDCMFLRVLFGSRTRPLQNSKCSSGLCASEDTRRFREPSRSWRGQREPF